jgi:O-antigen/teichoic acid export membrane protein
MTEAPLTTPSGAAPRRGLPRHLSDPLYRTGYLLMIGGGVGSLLGFLFWTLAARRYAPHVVGVNSAALSAMMLVSGVCQLGLNAVLVRYVPVAGDRARALIMRSYAVTICLSLVFGALAALTSGTWSPSLRFLADDPAWLVGFTFATAVWTVFTLQDSVMTGLQAPHWVPIENSLFAAAKVILLLGVASLAPVAGPFIAWNAPVGVAVVLITALIFRRLLRARRRGAVGLPVARRQLLRLAAGNSIASLFSLPVAFLMPVVVADATNPTTTAYFYAPWMIASAMQLVALNTATSLTLEGALDVAQLRQLLRRSVIHTMRMVVPIAAVAILAAPVILGAFGARYEHAGVPVLRWLALATIPNAVVALGLAVARLQHRGGVLVAIQVAECVPLFGLTAVLLTSSGIVGVGIAFLASQTAVAVVLLASLLRPLLQSPAVHA